MRMISDLFERVESGNLAEQDVLPSRTILDNAAIGLKKMSTVRETRVPTHMHGPRDPSTKQA